MITKLVNIQAWTTISGAQQLQINFGLTPQTTFPPSKSEFIAQPLRHFVSNTSTRTHAHAHTQTQARPYADMYIGDGKGVARGNRVRGIWVGLRQIAILQRLTD